MKIVITEEQKKKLFIPRKFNKDDHRWMDHNNSQPIVDGVRINQYDEEGRKQGYWEVYHDNGRLYKKGNYVDNMKDGYWERYHSNGQLFSKGMYKNDKLNGYWEIYWSDGVLNWKGNYVDDEKEGYWERYWDNGNLESKGNYKNGDKVGYWEYYYSNGRFSSKGVYKNGKFFNNLTESEKKKLFIPRKFNKDDSRYDDWNNKQPIKDGVRINQYDYEGIKQGYWEFYYSDGQLESKGSYVDGKEEGYWEYYYLNGRISSKGSYKNGKADGYWESYWDNGKLYMRGSYINGERVKNLTESEKKKLFIPRKFNKDDHRWMDHNNSQPIKNINGEDIRINQFDENGLKQGYWEFYYSDGQLESKGNFVNGIKEGYWESYYYNNGQLSSKGNYVNGKVNGYLVSYWSDGGIMSKNYYENGKRVKNLTESEKKKLFIPRKFNKDDHRWMDHNKTQPIKDGVRINQYDENGLKQGYWEHYYYGRLDFKGNYVDDIREGYWESYYGNGVLLSKGNFKDGGKEGYWEYYHDNGQLWEKGNYVNGKRDGYWEFYYENGQLESKGNYNDGEKEGYWEFYLLNGKLKSKSNYVNGKKVKNLTESEKKKLFIPRKLSKDDSRYDDWNNKQPIKDGVRINQYDYEGRKQGYWEEYYSNGQLFSKGNYKDDKQDGYWEYYYPNSKIMSKGNFINGEKDGYWEDYYDNGQLMSKNYYENGKRVKNLTESEKKKLFIPRKFNKDDHRWMDHNNSQPVKDGVRINQYDENGLKQGYWEHYYYGRLDSKGNFINGEKDGYWEDYYNNGDIYSKGNYVDGKREGYWEYYYSDGVLGSKGRYVDGKMEGYWEDYYNNGNIYSKGSYVDGKRNGYWDRYYENGELSSKGNYVNGKLVDSLNESEKKKLFIPRKFNKDDHRWMDHNNSQPMKDGVRINQYDENGLKQGYWEEYFSSGQLEGKGNYKDDKVDGYWEFYWSNGQLSTKGNYIDGDMDGYWVSYWSDGGIMSKGYYENGKRVKNLTESISPSEATTNIGSFKTLEDGKRGVAFITLKDNNPSVNRYISESIKRNDFGFILVKENPYNGIIVFKKEYRPQAEELYKIAMKYGGILSYKATYEETKRIGEILEYHPEDIESHLKQKYGSKNINEGTSYEYKLDPLYSDPNNRQIIYEFTGKDNVNFEVVFTNIGDNYWEREYRTNKNGLGVINTNDVYNILETVTKITLDFIETYQPETIYILHISNKKEKMMGIDTVKQPTKRALLNKKFLSPAINKLDNYYYKLIGSKSVISKI